MRTRHAEPLNEVTRCSNCSHPLPTLPSPPLQVVFGPPGTTCSGGNHCMVQTSPGFGAALATSYHNFKIVWSKGGPISWMLDGIVYRSYATSPWRPQTVRPILRTNIGTPASQAVLPDAQASPAEQFCIVVLFRGPWSTTLASDGHAPGFRAPHQVHTSRPQRSGRHHHDGVCPEPAETDNGRFNHL